MCVCLFLCFIPLFLFLISLNDIPFSMNLFLISCFFFCCSYGCFFSSILCFISLSFGHLYEAGCPKFLQLMQYGCVFSWEGIPLVCAGRYILHNGILGCNWWLCVQFFGISYIGCGLSLRSFPILCKCGVLFWFVSDYLCCCLVLFVLCIWGAICFLLLIF